MKQLLSSVAFVFALAALAFAQPKFDAADKDRFVWIHVDNDAPKDPKP